METTTWEKLYYIGEFVGVIAVVLTLGYLALQVRFARLAAADLNRHSRTQGVRDMMLTIATNPGLATIWLKATQTEPNYQAIANDLDISIDEAIQADFISLYWFWIHWGQYVSITTPEDRAELEHIITQFYSVPPGSVSWKRSPFGRDFLDERFVQFVGDTLAKKKGMGISQ